MCRNCSSRGYTLIEILVAISLTLIISFFGIGYYNKFNRRQRVEQATKKVVSDIRLAKNMALSQQKSQGTCTILKAYVFSFLSDSYQILEMCDGPETITPIKEVNLEGVTLEYNADFTKIKFFVLTQGVELGEEDSGLTEGSIIVKDFPSEAYQKEIEINAVGGDIKIN